MDPPAQSWQQLRKPNKSSQRTKTGCLTCRKRRIKCGEEKPVCRNCIKSKKECEGYTQQLKFRPPVGVDSAGSPTTAAGQAASRTERSSLSQQHEQLQRRDVRQARQERLAFNHRRQQRQQFEFHHESPASSSGTTNAASHNSSTNHSPPAKSDPSHSSVETAGSRLATYRPSPLASPLTDPGVSLIYRHFVLNASSMFLALERCVVDRETLVRGSSDPADRRGIFSHTVPLMALNNSALSQAILAFGCQHLAKGGYPIHSSFAFAHYHFALQRLPQSLNMPNNHIANIAISLLLALQDGLDCSHGMWSVNLSRIDQLFRTIDIPAQLRALKSLRLELAANPASNTPDIRAANRYAAIENEVDDSLLSEFVGRPVSFDSFCHLEQGSLSPSYNPQPMTAAQIDNLRILNDLYWMYLKFDTCMVSLVGKHPSGMEDCPLFPPRAAMNKPGALYGTLDHLLVICRRILAFGFCERQRKTKIADRNGGKWPFNPPARRDPVLISPPPESPDRSASVDMGMGMGVGVELGVGAGMGTGVNEGLNAGMKTPPHQLNRQEVIPEYFTYPNPPLLQSPPPEDVPSGADAYASSRAAEVEWHRIKGALALFHSYLVGPTFEPLAAPASSPVYSSTPFGPPIYYRDPMANLVMIFYHVSHLILDRLHPILPPDPLSAIIHAAPAAMPHVNMLPRLFAGMPAPDSAPSTEAYIDAVVCSFYGGLQVTDPNSRRWLVELWAEFGYITRAGARETLIPGAERTWMALHRLKFGPAYVPVVYRPDQEKERERARRQESGRDSSSAGGHEYAVRGGGAWMYSSAFDSVYDGMCNEEDGGSSNSSSVDEDEYSISQISERFASLTMCIELEQKREEDLQTLWMQQAMQRNEKKAPEGGETVDAVNTGGAVGGRGWC